MEQFKPLLEGAALILARALAAAGGAAAGVEIAKKRTKAAEESKSTPIARSDAGTRTKKNKKCEMCPPDCGNISTRSTAGWSETSIDYQARIGGMAVVPGFIAEWQFNGVSFDGFDSSQCLLKEAKAKYDQFIEDRTGRPFRWWQKGELALMVEAARQNTAASPSPPTKLNWYWMEPASYRFFAKRIGQIAPKIKHIYEP